MSSITLPHYLSCFTFYLYFLSVEFAPVKHFYLLLTHGFLFKGYLTTSAMVYLWERGVIIEFAVRQVFHFPVHDLHCQYPNLLCTDHNFPESQELDDALEFCTYLMDWCKQSIIVHISEYLSHNFKQFMASAMGHALSRKFHHKIRNVGDTYYHPPASRSWCKMKALSNYLTVCIGSKDLIGSEEDGKCTNWQPPAFFGAAPAA